LRSLDKGTTRGPQRLMTLGKKQDHPVTQSEAREERKRVIGGDDGRIEKGTVPFTGSPNDRKGRNPPLVNLTGGDSINTP